MFNKNFNQKIAFIIAVLMLITTFTGVSPIKASEELEETQSHDYISLLEEEPQEQPVVDTEGEMQQVNADIEEKVDDEISFIDVEEQVTEPVEEKPADTLTNEDPIKQPENESAEQPVTDLVEDKQKDEEVSSEDNFEVPTSNDEEITYSNPDNLSVFDDTPIDATVRYDIYPATGFGATRLRARSLSATRAAELAPGEVNVTKVATPVDGMVNTWDITLRIEGKDAKKTSDVVLVIDTSGSMANNGRMTSAINAANAFIDTFFPATGTQSDTTRIGIVPFQSEVGSITPLTNNRTTLRNKVNSLSANGGTFTQAGIRQAQAMLANSNADNKHIVLLSDGEPTYSYSMNNPKNYSTPYDGRHEETTSGAPRGEYTNDRVGNGSDLRASYDREFVWDWLNSYWKYYYYNHGNSAIAEAGFAKTAGSDVWTIALEAGPIGTPILNQMASPGKSYNANPGELQNIFENIAGAINSAVKEASVNDPMAQGFEIKDADIENIEVSQGTYLYENNRLSWDPGTLTTPVSEGSDVKYAQIKYRVVLNDDILKEDPNENGEYPTNGNAVVSYVDINGENQTTSFPVPSVNPVLYTVKKTLLDKDGNKMSIVDRNFNVQVTGPGDDGTQTVRDFLLSIDNGEASTRLMTDLRYASTYTFKEVKGNLDDYDVTYKVNGVEKSLDDLSFYVADNNTEDIEVEVINKEKPVSITAKKVWENGPLNDEVKLQLYRNDVLVEGQEVDTTDLSYTWENLTRNDEMEVPYKYTVKEVGTYENYDTTYSADGLTVTNTYVIPKTSVNVTKTWVDESGVYGRPSSVTLKLTRSLGGVDDTEFSKEYVLNGGIDTNSWNYVFEDLDKTDINGAEYVYKVEEVVPEGYDVTYDNTDQTNQKITNTLQSFKVTLKKLVTGNMAEYDRDFTFNYVITYPNSTTKGERIALKHNRILEITLPYGASIEVTETLVEGYTTKTIVGESIEEGLSRKLENITSDYELVFENNKGVKVPTGIFDDQGPMIIALVIVVAMGVWMFVNRRRNLNEV